MSPLFGINITPANVFSALTSLTQVSDRFRRRRDPRAVFPDVYAIITRRVADEVAKGEASCFLEPAWIGRLAGLFAVRYFESLTASLDGIAQPSTAWQLAYEYAAEGRTLPTHDALLGINAHINFDLAQGIYDNIVAAGAAHDQRLLARYRHDHDAVNEILEAALPECLALLANRYCCPVARIVVYNDRVQAGLCRLTLAMLKLWRNRVWSDVLSLLAANQSADKDAILARTNRDSGIIARLVGLAAIFVGKRPHQSHAAPPPSPSLRALPSTRPVMPSYAVQSLPLRQAA